MREFSSRAALLIAASACSNYTTYGYQYRMQQQFGGGEEPEVAPVEAKQLLANAKTVAFYPPDACINVDTTAGEAKLKQLRANCGVLLSTLERAAERAGYEVLSWQNLKGGKRPIDHPEVEDQGRDQEDNGIGGVRIVRGESETI